MSGGGEAITVTDEWGKNPSVQAMRCVFHAMEETHKAMLDLLSLSPWDPRLRAWRESARIAFESAWARAARLGLILGEKEAANLYGHCLGKTLEADGVTVPEELRTMDQTLDNLFKEGLP